MAADPSSGGNRSAHDETDTELSARGSGVGLATQPDHHCL